MPQAGEGQDEFCQKEAQEIEEREGKEGRGKGEEEAGWGDGRPAAFPLQS